MSDPEGKTSTLDPATQAFLDAARASGQRPLYEMTGAEARVAYKRARAYVVGDPLPVGQVSDRTIAGANGPIPVRLYRPDGLGDSAPALIYLHGGGWTIGDIDTHDSLCRELATYAGCVVMAVDYHLGPEHRFPIAVDDSIAALRWLSSEADTLGIDRARIAIGGDSAGANLATVACLIARDEGGPAVAYQLLVYPATDQMADSPSHERLGAGYYLTRELISYFRGNYVDEKDWGDWRASPLKAKSVGGLPEALVITAGFDPLLDEGLAYADRMRKAGVRVTYRCYEHQIHGFLNLGKIVPEAQQAVRFIASELARALHERKRP